MRLDVDFCEAVGEYIRLNPPKNPAIAAFGREPKATESNMAAKVKSKSTPAKMPNVALADRFQKTAIKSKTVFRDLCELKEEILRRLAAEPEGKLAIGDGRSFERVDNFATLNTLFKNTAFDHFNVVVTGKATAS